MTNARGAVSLRLRFAPCLTPRHTSRYTVRVLSGRSCDPEFGVGEAEKDSEAMNENETKLREIQMRPWLAVLTVLVCVLIALLARPELLDRGFQLAGL